MAANVEFTIKDLSKDVLKAKDAAVLKFLKEAGLHLEGEAAFELENDPRRIDTGLLRNSITHALSGEAPAISSYKADRARSKAEGAQVETGSYNGTAPQERRGRAVYVGTNVEYAPYVHDGTMRMLPNRFLKNAFEKNKDQIKEKLEETLRGD